MNTDALANPVVLITLAAIMALAVTLTIAVVRTLQTPAKRQTFHEALDYVWSSELDIDTALNKDENTSRNWWEYWANLTSSSGRVVTDEQAPGRVAAGAAIFGAVIGFLIYPGGIVGAVAAGVVALAVLRAILGSEARKRIIAMEKQLPQLLSGLRANLQAGSTPQQSMLAVADDLPSPLGDELRILKTELNVNVPLETALHSLSDRVPSREMKFLVASIEIAVRSGADLDPQLATIQDIVAQRTRIRQKLRAAVAQVKPTQMLALGAVPLMFVVSYRSPDNRAYWMGDGFWMMIVAAALYCLGYYAIRLMVKGVENA